LHNPKPTPFTSLGKGTHTPDLFSHLSEKSELILGGQLSLKNRLADDGDHAGVVGGQF
jgi:hypothetical protein